MLYTYDDGMASKFQNVGTKSSDTRRLPKKHNMAFNTRQKFEIKIKHHVIKKNQVGLHLPSWKVALSPYTYHKFLSIKKQTQYT